MNIVTYTAIFGNIDRLWSVYPLARGQSDRVVFTDNGDLREVGLWSDDERTAIRKGTSGMSTPRAWEPMRAEAAYGPRRTARHYKALPHHYMPDADVWIWVDGNVRLLAPPKVIVDKYLGDADLAIFKHPDRDCLYNEAAFCAKVHKGSPGILGKQTRLYEVEGMPRKWGLPETRVVIRRNTERIRELNDLWWHEIQEHSVRDQVSLPFVCWKLGLRWREIPGRCWVRNEHPHFHYEKHKR